MILCNSGFCKLSERIKKENIKIIVYGAGMISNVVIPYYIMEYGLLDYLDSFVDVDSKKTGKEIEIADRKYTICSPDYFEKINFNFLIIVSNSKFNSVIEFLDSLRILDSTETYIFPIMQIKSIDKEMQFIRHSSRQLIPQKIHYCWFGKSEMPLFLQECIASWHKICPEYDIVEWNESNYDISRHRYTKEAYEYGRYGFVTDIARLDILYEEGGIYLDTDVSVIKNFDELLYQTGFIGTEKWGNINSGGGVGFVKGNELLKELISYRDQYGFVLSDGSLNVETNGLYETSFFIRKGFIPNSTTQVIDGVTIYPYYIMSPYDYMSGECIESKSTFSIHHFYGGWMDKSGVLDRDNTRAQYRNIINRMNGGII